MNAQESIEATKRGFEASFGEGKLYDRQTQDEKHLNQIIEALHILPNSRILDLGTGTGYVSMEIARRYPEAHVIGLDIVEEALKSIRAKASDENLDNIEFVSYDGSHFPFEQETFDVIVTRYALHHFPDITNTFTKLAGLLKKGGQFLIADPTPNDNDHSRFVDAFMKMKPDGHIKYYTKDEFEELGNQTGLTLSDSFQSEITFPRLKSTANGYSTIMQEHGQDIISGYQVHETPDGQYIYITQKVWNLSFLRS